MVDKQEIVDNDYDLSINKYKKVEYVAVEYPPTEEILDEIDKLNAQIAKETAEYMFFTSSADESKRFTEYQHDGEGIIMGTGGNATSHYYSGKYSTSTDCVVLGE